MDKTAAIVGAGLVGLLDACYLADEGVVVDVYEKYPDPRILRPGCVRSINLTLSHRGEESLRQVGLLDTVLRDSIPAYGRVAWSGDGKVLGRVNYGEKGESIGSVRRCQLNRLMLDAAERYENIRVHFKHELSLCDFDAGTATFTHTEKGEKKEKTVSADLFIGADGAHSAMRAEMQKQRKLDRVDFKYHDHWYTEMCIPPINGEYQLEKNRLHVWPKDSFTLICLPNLDASFSGTLVMPVHLFDQMLESEESLVAFFKKEFSQVFDLVGEENLIQQFKPGQPDRRKPCRLASLKCQPYHASSSTTSKFVLHGDAAHAMVPFYGQGMNTGFEDVQKFHAILRRHGYTKEGIHATLEEFSNDRCKDGQAMSDFSYGHYEALCTNVKKRDYTIRRRIDSALHRLFPHRWIPEYTLVAFSSVPHSKCREICKTQDKIVSHVFFWMVVFMLVPCLLMLSLAAVQGV